MLLIFTSLQTLFCSDKHAKHNKDNHRTETRKRERDNHSRRASPRRSPQWQNESTAEMTEAQRPSSTITRTRKISGGIRVTHVRRQQLMNKSARNGQRRHRSNTFETQVVLLSCLQSSTAPSSPQIKSRRTTTIVLLVF